MIGVVYVLASTLAGAVAALCVAGAIAWRTKTALGEAMLDERNASNRADAAEAQNALFVDEIAQLHLDVAELNKALVVCQQKATNADLQTIAHGDDASVDAIVDRVLSTPLPDLSDPANGRAIADVDTVFDSAATGRVSPASDHQ